MDRLWSDLGPKETKLFLGARAFATSGLWQRRGKANLYKSYFWNVFMFPPLNQTCSLCFPIFLACYLWNILSLKSIVTICPLGGEGVLLDQTARLQPPRSPRWKSKPAAQNLKEKSQHPPLTTSGPQLPSLLFLGSSYLAAIIISFFIFKESGVFSRFVLFFLFKAGLATLAFPRSSKFGPCSFF